jgi:hypothetical protein
MAQSWISLADLAERNSHLDRIDETPPRRESPTIRGTGVCHYPAPLLLHAGCREGEGSQQALTTVDRPILEPMNENRSAKRAGAMEHDDFRFRRYY